MLSLVSTMTQAGDLAMAHEQVTDAELREEFLKSLPPYPRQMNWESYTVSRPLVDKDRLKRLCIRLKREGEIVNVHPPADGELASHVRRPEPQQGPGSIR